MRIITKKTIVWGTIIPIIIVVFSFIVYAVVLSSFYKEWESNSGTISNRIIWNKASLLFIKISNCLWLISHTVAAAIWRKKLSYIKVVMIILYYVQIIIFVSLVIGLLCIITGVVVGEFLQPFIEWSAVAIISCILTIIIRRVFHSKEEENH